MFKLKQYECCGNFFWKNRYYILLLMSAFFIRSSLCKKWKAYCDLNRLASLSTPWSISLYLWDSWLFCSSFCKAMAIQGYERLTLSFFVNPNQRRNPPFQGMFRAFMFYSQSSCRISLYLYLSKTVTGYDHWFHCFFMGSSSFLLLHTVSRISEKFQKKPCDRL